MSAPPPPPDTAGRARPRAFLAWFPLSAAFWWLFEYLNRFAGNWRYVGTEPLGALEYACFASASFSTVLPAVLSMTAWLGTFEAIVRAFSVGPRLRVRRPRRAAWAALAAGAISLGGVGAWPQWLFPLLWISPLFVVVPVAVLARHAGGFGALAAGDWRPVALPAIAALACGGFWEMWNWGSVAHWVYAIPWVDRFHLFGMPILGYASYLPFGLVCLAAAQTLDARPTIDALAPRADARAGPGLRPPHPVC